jgi:hypothetical protein
MTPPNGTTGVLNRPGTSKVVTGTPTGAAQNFWDSETGQKIIGGVKIGCVAFTGLMGVAFLVRLARGEDVKSAAKAVSGLSPLNKE